MKLNLKPFYLLIVLLGLTFSCQDEVVEETPTNEEETLVADSNLAVLMRNTVTLDGSMDNIIDHANCILIDLPVTVVVNGVTLTIESVEDYDAIEEIIDEFTNDQDEIEIQFPIVIILSDYTEVTIENQEELETYIEDCFGENEPDDDIECIDFQYPITFSIYNSNFQVIDTVEIHSDQELYVFIEELEGGVLASINFPINMVLASGEVIEVNNNTELEIAIAEAEDDCDEDDDNDHNDDDECNLSLDFVELWLYECPIVAHTYDENGDLLDENLLEFGQNGEVVVNGTPTVTEIGAWTLEETNIGIVLNISGLNTFNLIDGDWTLTSCENNHLEFSQETGSGTRTMVFEMDCNVVETPFDCFGNTTVTACDFDNDGFTTFELETQVLGNVTCNVDFTPSFHLSQTNAEANVNPIVEPNAFVNTMNPQTIYLRIEALNGDFEVFAIELIVEDCSSSCSEVEVDAFLQECIWNVVNFNGDDHLISYDFDFISTSEVVITGNGLTIVSGWSTSQSANGTIVEFSNVSGPDIQAITGSWLVVECREDRLQFEALNNTDTMVMERDCSDCTNPGILTNDLVVYMPFAGEAKDLISGESVPNITNGFVEDRAGNTTCAIGFTGNDNISIPVTSENQIVQGDSFSISVWFKMQNTDAGDLEIFFRKPGNATVGFNLGAYDLNTPLFGDNLSTTLWDNDWNQEVDVVWDNTDWHHLVATVDSNNTVRLYRDGELRNVVENSDLSIGSDPATQYLIGEGFQGHLDDLRVYKRTLSANEVGDLYNLEADCHTCL
ncbi:LamG domain-containing protein [Hanstruepera marina]|uniref:LamG domain-containing protein n=1 Tax=Hanstruepera marina TaxID=2873265 RepID=UPI001CA6E255|nr:LamG domain-containing protein [Hanstruepera marina]